MQRFRVSATRIDQLLRKHNETELQRELDETKSALRFEADELTRLRKDKRLLLNLLAEIQAQAVEEAIDAVDIVASGVGYDTVSTADLTRYADEIRKNAEYSERNCRKDKQMGNMSYCRFENTSADLQDCLDALENIHNGDEELPKSSTERDAIEELFRQCNEVLQFEEEMMEKME